MRELAASPPPHTHTAQGQTAIMAKRDISESPGGLDGLSLTVALSAAEQQLQWQDSEQGVGVPASSNPLPIVLDMSTLMLGAGCDESWDKDDDDDAGDEDDSGWGMLIETAQVRNFRPPESFHFDYIF